MATAYREVGVVTDVARLWRAMGNPHRFFGSGEPIDLGEGQVIPARCAVEVTFRTHQQRFLLCPDEQANETILGCFGRAYHRYPELELNVLKVLSNHGHFLCRPPSSFVLWNFMRDLLSTSALKLNGVRDREGTFWERRYRAIPILDEEAYDERFRYVLTQGTKENLVWSARDWPGVSSIGSLLGDEPLVGRWRDGSREYELRRQRERKLERARRSGRELELPPAPEVWVEYPIPHVPPPHWEPLSDAERHARVADMIRTDDEQTRARHARDDTRPLGVQGVLDVDPFDRPEQPDRSPAPRCHTTCPTLRAAFLEAARAHADLIKAAGEHALEALAAFGLPESTPLAPMCRKPALAPRRPPPEPTLRPPHRRPRPASIVQHRRSSNARSMGSYT